MTATRQRLDLRPLLWLALLLWAATAHGCHFGDHDDEPCYMPARVVEGER